MPPGVFDLILCRNLAFTYFDEQGQSNALRRLLEHLRPNGALVLGRRESLPCDGCGLRPWAGAERLNIHHREEQAVAP